LHYTVHSHKRIKQRRRRRMKRWRERKEMK
jgi:hypothetical protein